MTVYVVWSGKAMGAGYSVRIRGVFESMDSARACVQGVIGGQNWQPQKTPNAWVRDPEMIVIESHEVLP